ncbi:MAG TPA: hypothetical protein VGF55_33670 [Gemmataceae bacterium]|jgi:hypothetical protein
MSLRFFLRELLSDAVLWLAPAAVVTAALCTWLAVTWPGGLPAPEFGVFVLPFGVMYALLLLVLAFASDVGPEAESRGDLDRLLGRKRTVGFLTRCRGGGVRRFARASAGRPRPADDVLDRLLRAKHDQADQFRKAP